MTTRREEKKEKRGRRSDGCHGRKSRKRSHLLDVAREAMAQGTLEYAITMFAMLALIAGIAALWRAGQDGAFVELAENAASHLFSGTGMLDIALY